MAARYRFQDHPLIFAVIFAVIILLIHLLGSLFFPGKEIWVVISDIYFPLVGFLCSGVLFQAARETRKVSKQIALVWLLIALGRFTYTLGDVTWGIQELLLHRAPFLSVTDVFYPMIYPLWIAAILFIPRVSSSRVERYKLILDSLIIFLSASLMFSNYLIAPLITLYTTQPFITRFLGIVYPVLDLLMVWVFVIPFMYRLKGQDRTPIMLLGASAVAMVISDYLIAYQSVLGTYRSSGPLDNVFILSYLLSGLAGVAQIIWAKEARYQADDTTEQSYGRNTRAGPPHLMPYLWLGVVYILFVVGNDARYPLTEKILETCIGAIMLLVISRQILVTRENMQLATELKDANLDLEAHISQLDLANQDLSREVIEREKVENALRQSEERYRDLFDHATDLIMLVAPNGSILFTNRAWREALHYSTEETQNLYLEDIILPEVKEQTLHDFQRAIEGETLHQIDTVFVASDKHPILVEGNANCSFAEGRPVYIRSIFRDVTERKQAEERLVYEAFHDGLTGLPNRAFLLDRLRVSLLASKDNPNHHFAVLFLDLDQFKLINDSLGHTLGDEFLIGIARELCASTRSNDLVARLGGDEFVVLLTNINGLDDATRVAERIIDTIKQPHNLEGHTVFSSPSIGVVVDNPNYQSPEDVLRDADIAMYRAKAQGKGRMVIFDESMRDYAVSRLEMERDLRHALDEQQFHLVYQPIYSLRQNYISGFEALIRWKHPERGLVMPGEFIQVAEETGLILPMGEWILKEACSQMVDWQHKFPGMDGMKMSVNLSAKQFNQPGLVEKVQRILLETGLDPNCLAMEITETVLMDDLDRAAGTLRRLQDLGICLSIDDFGTGYSSLGYLQRLPIKMIKIDRSFISRVNTGSNNVEIVRAILQLAHTLGMSVIAEGLEKPEQLSVVKDLGCDFGQGYLLARPAPATQIEALLRQSKKVLVSGNHQNWPMWSLSNNGD